MAEPQYTLTTERLYERLPDFLRQADSRNDWLLKRWFSAIADQQGSVDILIARLDYLTLADGGEPGDTSDLVDATTADAAWLDWLGQLFGVRSQIGLTEQERRDAVRYASSGFRAGTKKGVATAASSALTGTRFAQVYDHSVYQAGDGGQWDVLVVTRSSETPDVNAVLRSIVAKRAKPAGVLLWHRAYATPWATLETIYPVWSTWDATRDWNEIEERGLVPFYGRPYGTGNFGEGAYG